ncbi:retrovirus-related Pol polyprotein from type-1 retrotransposable element R1 4 [Elysia marginata]|uniref:Retrovirus-related Pol polyprotein from type-1 retrotransposable element R1 4 n=1 Tax=Elysia marginata TaxID=1093978 RepID=A0AAV4HKG7_9GAST|nr:retrovirus-related Pol polyprotein from type-1 retrotransposable element R1 4 [Elysia marginata]
MNLDLERLQKYCDTLKITINTNKTSYSIFTLNPKVTKQNLNIRLTDQQLKKEEHPSYLGVQLDPRLNLKKHAANLKRKTMKRLSLIKRLTSTSWGSDMDTLRSLYLGYVRSVLHYNLCPQASSSKTVQSEIDRVQNHALRFICGGMRSTPTAVCEIHARIEPLGLRREKATLEMYERAQRMNPLHPAELLVENWKKKDRIQYPTIMHHITTLQERCHFSNDRKPICRVPKMPPKKEMKSPEVITHLKNQDTNKKTDPALLKLEAEITILTYPPDWFHICTDGSAFKATVNAG